MCKSWETTVAGIVAIAAAVVLIWMSPAEDSKTWAIGVSLIAAGVGLMRARDNDKSSEDVGTKAKAPGRNGLLSVMLLAVMAVGMGGCAGERMFVEAADSYHQTVGEAWTAYVQSDPTLSEDAKRVRLQAHAYFGRAVEARRQALGP